MSETLRLNDKARLRLQALYQAAQAAQQQFAQAMSTAVEMLGLDASLDHKIDFQTGLITPADDPTKLHVADVTTDEEDVFKMKRG